MDGMLVKLELFTLSAYHIAKDFRINMYLGIPYGQDKVAIWTKKPFAAIRINGHLYLSCGSSGVDYENRL